MTLNIYNRFIAPSRLAITSGTTSPPESRPAYVSSRKPKIEGQNIDKSGKGLAWETHRKRREICVSELGNDTLHNGESSSSLLVDGSGRVRGDRSGDVESSGEGVHCKECEVLY
jgi:hypothetical protein